MLEFLRMWVFIVSSLTLYALAVPLTEIYNFPLISIGYSDYVKNKWNSFTIGEEYNFRREGKHFEEVSAVVFPFSIPDGIGIIQLEDYIEIKRGSLIEN